MGSLINYITPLNVKELLESNDQYVIPIYQRNYAWEAKEIEQLIQDIIDYSIYHTKKNYYIGTLVVAPNSKEEFAFDTIDGQQRLTTLSILTSVIKNEFKEINLDWYKKLNLRFACRKKSMLTLQAAYSGNFMDKEYEVNIKAAYEICKKELEKKIKEYNISLKDFTDYLYEFVSIIRVSLPEGIDLNHYFEIMNSRGEQLEKHEILKAKLMSCFEISEQRYLYEYCFDLIWEACSNMERYVHYGFTTNQRHLLFGKDDWNDLTVYSFDDFVKKISSLHESGIQASFLQDDQLANTIDEIIKSPTIVISDKGSSDQPDRFNSVINFQNFLMHVLKVQTDDDKIALDDKRLLAFFDELMPSGQSQRIDFVKTYIFNLLKCKFLYDKYIIKREFTATANAGRWSLKSLKWYSSATTKNAAKYVNTFGDEQNEDFDNENRRVLMLLSMFHVSIPSMSYKYWLYAALNYVFHQTEVTSKNFISYLEHIAKSFVFDKYLAKVPSEYSLMINKNLKPTTRDDDQFEFNKLCYGNIENNLVFNFCDYLLWLEYKDKERDPRVKSFEFSFRSSVEHYYPQNPINSDIDRIDESYLHSFGNLCLISHEKNSRLNNFSPIAKMDHYGKSTTIDSMKQYVMMKITAQHNDWGIIEINDHYSDMKELLQINMNSEFYWEINQISKARRWFKQFKIEDRVLLIRAIMCFGRIDVNIGWTSNMEKWNFYQWDKIEKRTAYQKFENYIEDNNPLTLQDLIDDQMKNNLELRKDSYRYALVSRPHILKYCKEGNIGWADNGKRFILLEFSRATKYQSCDFYCFCIKKYLKSKYNVDSYCGSDRLKIALRENENHFSITSLDWSAIAFLEIWNDDKGNLCYELNTRNIHGNSKTLRYLKENGWDYNHSGRLFFTSKQFLLVLSSDIENNIEESEKEIDYLISQL